LGGLEPQPQPESQLRPESLLQPEPLPPILENLPEAVSLPEAVLPPKTFPIWTLGDVFRILMVLLLAIFFTGILAAMVAAVLPAFRNAKSAQIAMDPRIVVPSQVVAYLVTIYFVYRMIALHYRADFWEAIHWRWPRNWMTFLGAGLILSFFLQIASHLLPIPKQMPIDQMFQTQSGVWLMALFGTFIAPFAEELFFRGLLYPALVRKSGMPIAVIFTSLTFAFIHASQLGWSVAAVSILAVVGLTLTLVRAYAKSLAASTIVHMGYNAFIFGLIFIGTHGFRKL
jgi:uncharacterized protein